MGAVPTVEVVGPGGKMRINEDELESYLKKGFRLAGEPAPEPEASLEPEAEAESEGDESDED